jgi:hypothetical protein
MRQLINKADRVPVSKNFYLDEFLPPSIYFAYVKNPQSMRAFFDPRLVTIAQAIRDNIQTPMTINNWATGGNREWSCVRIPASRFYRAGSMHSYRAGDVVARAVDCVFGNTTAAQVRQHIISNYDAIYKPLGLRRIEDDVSWLHFDLRPTTSDRLVVFKP